MHVEIWVGVLSGVLSSMAVLVGGTRWAWKRLVTRMAVMLEERVVKRLTDVQEKVTVNGGTGRTLATRVQRMERTLAQVDANTQLLREIRDRLTPSE